MKLQVGGTMNIQVDDYEVIGRWDYEVIGGLDYEVLGGWDYEVIGGWDYEDIGRWDCEAQTTLKYCTVFSVLAVGNIKSKLSLHFYMYSRVKLDLTLQQEVKFSTLAPILNLHNKNIP